MIDLTQQQKQSPIIIVLQLIKSMKGLLFFGVFFIFGKNRFTSDNYIFLGVIFLLSFLALAKPIISYFFFHFRLVDDEFIIDKGLLNKERKVVPIDRIQSVNITQNFLQQLFGVASLEIDTAGSKAKELEIEALNINVAEAVKAQLQSLQVQLVDQQKINGEEIRQENEVPSSSKTTASTPSQLVLELGVMDLIKISLTQNHLRSFGAALGLLIGFYFQFKDILESLLGTKWEESELGQFLDIINWRVNVILFLLSVIVAISISALTVVNRYYGYRMVRK